MKELDIRLPEMGEGIIEATITQYLVKVGDVVEEDTPLLEVATDKVDSEIVAPQEGTIKALLYDEGAIATVGSPVVVMSVEGEAEEEEDLVAVAPLENSVTAPITTSASKSEGLSHTAFLSPTVRAIIAAHGVSQVELSSIQGTGREGRITREDILQFVASKAPKGQVSQPATEEAPQVAPTSKVEASTPKPAKALSLAEGDEVVEMDRMRKLIAGHMVDSKKKAPHVSSFIEVDLTALVNWRKKHKKHFEETYGERLTFTTLFVKAAVKALEDFPMVNVSVDGENIIKRKHINIGMATALEDGNLIVPVIHDANQLALSGIAAKVNELAQQARTSKLKPADITGSTFTITNLGAFDSLTGTPIINQPEAAILAIGALKRKPAVVMTESGEGIGIRDMLILALSYDHRVIDGGLGGQFLLAMRNYLQDIDRLGLDV